MKLYIFKPDHSKWTYCGGSIIIFAKSFEEARELGRDSGALSDELFFEDEKDVPEDKTHSIWILHETFNIDTPDTQSRVILNDYNWG